MHLQELFYYRLPDGRTERTMHTLSPSNMRRANVPEDLINAYSIARSAQALPEIKYYRNGHREIINEEKINKAAWDAHNAIVEFLRNQEKEHFPDGNFFPKNA